MTSFSIIQNMANYNVYLGLSVAGVGTLANRNFNFVSGDTMTLSVNNNISNWNRWNGGSSKFTPSSHSNTTGTGYGTSPSVVFTVAAGYTGSYVFYVSSYRSSSQGGYAFKSGRVYGQITQATASYSLTAPNSIQEGTSGSIAVSASNHTPGTHYWSVAPTADFATSTGSIYVPSSGSRSFSLTPLADNSTEGNETATVRLFTNSLRTIQVASDTFTITDQAATGGGGGSTGGGTSGGSTNQGIDVFSQNGTKVFGTDLRTQNVQYEQSVSISGNSTSSTFSMADANDSTKVLITLLGYYPPSRFTINTSSTGFSITNNTSSTQTANLLAIRIG